MTLQNGAEIDLGGIAKGYIADRVAAYLKEQGVAHACINMGGNILVLGGKPDGTDWTIGIRDPNGTAEQSEEVLSLSDGAVVTSGNYERFFLRDGVRYHHLIDPDTLMPANFVLQTTILTRDSALADFLSTAAFLLPYAESRALIEGLEGVEAVWVLNDGSLEMTDGARAFVEQK